MKALNQLEKMKKRASSQLENSDTTFRQKMKMMEKIARKKMEKSSNHREKTYVVSGKGGQHRGKGKGGSKGKDVKFVDRRSRADARGLKRAEKRNKRRGIKPKTKGSQGKGGGSKKK